MNNLMHVEPEERNRSAVAGVLGVMSYTELTQLGEGDFSRMQRRYGVVMEQTDVDREIQLRDDLRALLRDIPSDQVAAFRPESVQACAGSLQITQEEAAQRIGLELRRRASDWLLDLSDDDLAALLGEAMDAYAARLWVRPEELEIEISVVRKAKARDWLRAKTLDQLRKLSVAEREEHALRIGMASEEMQQMYEEIEEERTNAYEAAIDEVIVWEMESVDELADTGREIFARAWNIVPGDVDEIVKAYREGGAEVTLDEMMLSDLNDPAKIQSVAAQFKLTPESRDRLLKEVRTQRAMEKLLKMPAAELMDPAKTSLSRLSAETGLPLDSVESLARAERKGRATEALKIVPFNELTDMKEDDLRGPALTWRLSLTEMQAVWRETVKQRGLILQDIRRALSRCDLDRLNDFADSGDEALREFADQRGVAIEDVYLTIKNDRLRRAREELQTRFYLEDLNDPMQGPALELGDRLRITEDDMDHLVKKERERRMLEHVRRWDLEELSEVTEADITEHAKLFGVEKEYLRQLCNEWGHELRMHELGRKLDAWDFSATGVDVPEDIAALLSELPPDVEPEELMKIKRGETKDAYELRKNEAAILTSPPIGETVKRWANIGVAEKLQTLEEQARSNAKQAFEAVRGGGMDEETVEAYKEAMDKYKSIKAAANIFKRTPQIVEYQNNPLGIDASLGRLVNRMIDNEECLAGVLWQCRLSPGHCEDKVRDTVLELQRIDSGYRGEELKDVPVELLEECRAAFIAETTRKIVGLLIDASVDKTEEVEIKVLLEKEIAKPFTLWTAKIEAALFDETYAKVDKSKIAAAIDIVAALRKGDKASADELLKPLFASADMQRKRERKAVLTDAFKQSFETEDQFLLKDGAARETLGSNSINKAWIAYLDNNYASRFEEERGRRQAILEEKEAAWNVAPDEPFNVAPGDAKFQTDLKSLLSDAEFQASLKNFAEWKVNYGDSQQSWLAAGEALENTKRDIRATLTQEFNDTVKLIESSGLGGRDKLGKPNYKVFLDGGGAALAYAGKVAAIGERSSVLQVGDGERTFFVGVSNDKLKAALKKKRAGPDIAIGQEFNAMSRKALPKREFDKMVSGQEFNANAGTCVRVFYHQPASIRRAQANDLDRDNVKRRRS